MLSTERVEELKAQMRTIIETFLELDEAQPSENDDKMYHAFFEQSLDLHELDGVFERIGRWDAYTYFGYGTMSILVKWEYYPIIKIGVWIVDNVRPDVPHDQAHRTWQRLLAFCERKGIDREAFKHLVEFNNY